MSGLRMGSIIEQIRDEVEGKRSLPKRAFSYFVGLVGKVTWYLWGRRRAIARMKQLALGDTNSKYRRLYSVEEQERRLADHREFLDSLKVQLPTPDAPPSTDVN